MIQPEVLRFERSPGGRRRLTAKYLTISYCIINCKKSNVIMSRGFDTVLEPFRSCHRRSVMFDKFIIQAAGMETYPPFYG